MSRVISSAEVAQHSSPSSAWIIVHGSVYDITKFAPDHPGGKKIILNMAGKDATKQFDQFHKIDVLTKHSALKIGVLEGAASSGKPSTAPKSKSSSTPRLSPPSSSPSSSSVSLGSFRFGEGVPYGDHNVLQGWKSPFFKPSHHTLRANMREFVEREIAPHVHEWDEAKGLPRHIWKVCGEFGLLAIVMGPPFPAEYADAGKLERLGVPIKEFDYFHENIVHDEVSRMGSGGLPWGLYMGLCIGGGPIIRFASKYLRDKVCRQTIAGEKIICLAITEPDAGSDVANVKTTATKTPDGKYYIVNGQKKWITNGIWADYFTTAVRTGGDGYGGLSLLLIERAFGGVTTTQMKCGGVWQSGTTYVTFEDVKVPVENLIGKEGEGFKYVMQNFNHERQVLSWQAIRLSRTLLEEAMKYAFKRKTFGKFLVEHPVIRFKLANMAKAVESTQAYLDVITHQMNELSFEEGVQILGGPIALAKVQTTQTFELCAREAAQIFGGLSYTRGGQGEKVERLYREVRPFAIGGGSEEVLLDLGIRQAVRGYAKKINFQGKL